MVVIKTFSQNKTARAEWKERAKQTKGQLISSTLQMQTMLGPDYSSVLHLVGLQAVSGLHIPSALTQGRPVTARSGFTNTSSGWANGL